MAQCFRAENGIVVEVQPHAAEDYVEGLFTDIPDATTVTVGMTWDGKAFGTAPAPVAPPVDLKAYAASARYTKETAGITVNGAAIATDRASQALITGAWATTQINPSATIQWKGSDGTFVTLDAKAITGLAAAVTAHVQACFAAEAQVGKDIASGKVKATADVDAAFAAVTV
ncbi:MAG: DUF4376 domain-containing protein [Janthinobacterium lividum]